MISTSGGERRAVGFGGEGWRSIFEGFVLTGRSLGFYCKD